MFCKMQYLLLLLIIVAASQERHNNRSFQWKDLDLLPTGQSRSTVSTDREDTLKHLLALNKNPRTSFSNSSIPNTNQEKDILNHPHEKTKRGSDIGRDSILLSRRIRSNNADQSSLNNGNWQSLSLNVSSKNNANHQKRNAATVKSHDICVPDVIVEKGRKEIIQSRVEEVTLYCKPKENFKQMEIQILADKSNSISKVSTVQKLGLSNHSLWYKIDIKAYIDYYGYNEWEISASVDGNPLIKESVGYTSALGNTFKSMRVNAVGPSIWKYSEPWGQCSSDDLSTTGNPFISTASSTVSPDDSTISQVDSTIFPDDSTIYPVDSTISLVDSTISPVDTTISPVDSTISPVDTTISPVDSTISPVDTTISPVDSTIYPVNSTKSPLNSTLSPLNSTISPVNSTISPVNSTIITVNSAASGGDQKVLNLVVIVVAIICAIVILAIVALLIRKRIQKKRSQPSGNLELQGQGAGYSTKTGSHLGSSVYILPSQGPHPETRPETPHGRENSLISSD